MKSNHEVVKLIFLVATTKKPIDCTTLFHFQLSTQTLSNCLINVVQVAGEIREKDVVSHHVNDSYFCIMPASQTPSNSAGETIWNWLTGWRKILIEFFLFLKLHNDAGEHFFTFTTLDVNYSCFAGEYYKRRWVGQMISPTRWYLLLLHTSIYLFAPSDTTDNGKLTSWLRAAFMPKLSTLRGKRRDVNDIIPDIFQYAFYSFVFIDFVMLLQTRSLSFWLNFYGSINFGVHTLIFLVRPLTCDQPSWEFIVQVFDSCTCQTHLV